MQKNWHSLSQNENIHSKTLQYLTLRLKLGMHATKTYCNVVFDGHSPGYPKVSRDQMDLCYWLNCSLFMILEDHKDS